MTKPRYINGDDFIVITYNNQPHTVYSGDARFKKLQSVIRNQSWNLLDETLSAAKMVEKYGFGKVKITDDHIVTYDGQKLHNALSMRIVEFIEKDHPFEHLVKFLDKLMSNPSERSRNQLFEYLERYKLPIDQNGDFLGFKSVTGDFMDHHTQTIDNSVGKTVKEDRNLISDDPHAACAKGLHLGNWGYVSSFGGGNSKIILVRVNPKDVVSIPHDVSYQKMRVCEYKVVKCVGSPNEVVDFTSNYIADNEVAKDVETEKVENISKEKAYNLHKEGVIVKSGKTIVKPDENKPRSFFRKYSNWTIYAEIVPINGAKIGANKAYEYHKAGKEVQSLTAGLVKSDANKPRSFFRSYTDWELV